MKKIKVMIAEDERLAREELIYLLEQEEDLEILESAINGKELLALAEKHIPDVIFLDIQMPEMDGIQTARMLRARMKKLSIVFTTAHEGYAIDAFELNAVDYLLKPYSYLRLKETLQRVRTRKAEQAETPVGAKEEAASASKLNKILMDDGEKIVVIGPENILYAMREDKVIHLYTTDHHYTSSKFTLNELEEKLQGCHFFRPHRSYLINLNQVDELIPWFNGAYTLTLKDKNRTKIPVSRVSAKELFKLL
ncbi:LytR/AlgR family response regulator transcription factor [Paenibacillus hexagrammi]|uniref:LytTR family DNA-binding domain-containing protein n=1 Tax=Paenibacillus hexagrammi TaxID=2908839 RepID=A0ABY3SJ43_9BACL|nr:LytTR family DNA-binding domain-containing protein [Paenibacillus sp. YPD9-1]UJF33956.1 LytTR family DNA-binding domain-containing protein [Paenibacillus sp. YPD9-1]